MLGLPTKYTIYINSVDKDNSVMITDDFDDSDAKYIFDNYDCDKAIVTENNVFVKEITRREFEIKEIDKICDTIDKKFKSCELRNYASLECICKNNNMNIDDYLYNQGYNNYLEYKDDLRFLARKELPINEILNIIPRTIKELIDYSVDDMEKESKLNNSMCYSQDDLVYADNEVCYYDCHDGDYIFIDTQEIMGLKEKTDHSYLKEQVLYVNSLSENLLQVDNNKSLYNDISIKYNLYDCIKENCYIDEEFKKNIEGIQEIKNYKVLSNCVDYQILKENLSKKKLEQLEKGLESYEYYQSMYYNDGDIIGEYQSKYGNVDLIDWYEGLLDTDELIKTLNCDIENEI